MMVDIDPLLFKSPARLYCGASSCPRHPWWKRWISLGRSLHCENSHYLQLDDQGDRFIECQVYSGICCEGIQPHE